MGLPDRGLNTVNAITIRKETPGRREKNERGDGSGREEGKGRGGKGSIRVIDPPRVGKTIIKLKSRSSGKEYYRNKKDFVKMTNRILNIP